METTKNKKQTGYWREILYSSDKRAIEQALKSLREDGNIEILKDIFIIYKGYKNTSLGDTIYDFMIDIKCSEAVPVIISAIDNIELKSIRKDLLTLCWQTSLDFSPHFEYFIDVFINSQLNEAFEAFTIIDCFEFQESDTELLENNVKKLMQNTSTISEDKKELLVDLVHVLKEKSKI